MTPRAEALELLARLVDEQEKPKGGRGKTRPESGQVLPKQRVAEGRLIARTGAVARVEAALAEHDGRWIRRRSTPRLERQIRDGPGALPGGYVRQANETPPDRLARLADTVGNPPL